MKKSFLETSSVTLDRFFAEHRHRSDATRAHADRSPVIFLSGYGRDEPETSRRAGLELVCIFGHDACAHMRFGLVDTEYSVVVVTPRDNEIEDQIERCLFASREVLVREPLASPLRETKRAVLEGISGACAVYCW